MGVKTCCRDLDPSWGAEDTSNIAIFVVLLALSSVTVNISRLVVMAPEHDTSTYAEVAFTASDEHLWMSAHSQQISH